MSELLPITQADLQLCAQRWGWLCATRPDGSGYARKEFTQWWFDPLCEDCFNAAAILDRERVLMLKGWSLQFLSNTHQLCFWGGPNNETVRYVRWPADYYPCGSWREAANFRSWLLVELTKALPEDVWK